MHPALQLILTIIFAVTVIGTVLVVISENRNPIRTLAWVIVLIFLPVVGLLCYYFFGQDTRKVRRLSDKYYRRLKKISLEEFLMPDSQIVLAPEYKPLAALLEKSNHAFLLQGSEVEIITRGPEKFELLMADLEKARHHIHMEYFIFYNDETGNMVKEMLMKKASEGVQVRFLYDNVANWFVPRRYYEEMKTSGVQVSSFMEVKLAAFHSKVNYRNHRKVVVIDGEVGYMGGMNIANDYRTDPNWRDTHLRIRGRGVYGLQANFIVDWLSSGKKIKPDREFFPVTGNYTNNLMQIAAGGPELSWRNLLLATIHLVTNAKQYVYIQTPYFLPDDSLMQALLAASLGGVDVRLMVSRKSDSPYVDPAAKSYYEELLRAGLKIYEMQGKFIHAKTMVVDDFVSVVGSANMDFRSFESNFEINCYMYDGEIASRMKKIFMDDAKVCKQIHLKTWQQRPRYKKFIESVMRLFAPLM